MQKGWYGLDLPVWQQYLTYMGHLLFQFDLGPSLRQPGWTVSSLYFGPNTMADVLREQLTASYGKKVSLTFAEPPSPFDSSVLVLKATGSVFGYTPIYWSAHLEAVRRFLTMAPIMVSVRLWLLSFTLALLLGIPAGISSALQRNG
jgi:ABC-type dipeptide/oligopeptide/nickel transport system permease component